MCERCKTEVAVGPHGLCAGCLQQFLIEDVQIDTLHAEGHSRHCACRQVYGHEACLCRE